MGKFAESLSNKENPEWAAFYINYQGLKDMLYEGIAKAPKITQAADVGKLNFVEYVNRFDQSFFDATKLELDKINRFYKDKIREASKKFTDLKNEAEGFQSESENERQNFWKKAVKPGTSVESRLRQSFRDLYGELGALSKYKDLNYLGFRKILKKHDKLFNSTTGAHYLRSKVHGAYFRVDKEVEDLIHQTESIVTTIFEDGSRAKAMKSLSIPHRDDNLNTWTAFKIGLMLGAGIVLVAVFAVSGVIDPSKNGWRIVIRFYRGPITAIMYICLVGIDIYIWRLRGVNHVHIFDLNPRETILHHHFWNMAAFLGVLWAVSLVVFLNAKNISIPVYISPLVLVVSQFFFLFNPFPFGYRSSRIWLLKVVFRCFTAPFHRVRFADFWVADQMASLVTILLDYQFIVCFYKDPNVFEIKNDLIVDHRVCITLKTGSINQKCICDSPHNVLRPILRMLPSLIRMLQCLRRFYDNHLICPHLVNCGKYLMSLLATIISTLHSTKPPGINGTLLLYMWLIGSITSSLYSFTWDIKMDWGLADWRSENRFLRNELLFKPWYYYIVITIDFFLRFSWAISLSLTEMGFVESDIMLTIVTPLEVFRRFMWNIFRLENEQINNNNAQKAVQLQLEKSESTVVLTEEQHMRDVVRMMDVEDGVDKITQRTASLVVSTAPSRPRFVTNSASRVFPDSRTELFTKVSSIEDLGSLTDVSSGENVPVHTKPGALGKFKKLFCGCFK